MAVVVHNAGEEGFSRRWRPALMAFFLRRVRDYGEAEDLTQEVLIRLLESDGDPHDGYVFRTAANLVIDRARRADVRRNHVHQAGFAHNLGIDPYDPHRIALGREQVAALIEGLGRLSDRQRNIIILYRMENISQEKIAESFGISVSAVKKQVAKATALLVKHMDTLG